MNNLRNFPPVTLGIFQSTLLQEERLKLKYIQNGNSYFNPRSYKRSDFYCGICGSCSYHFNPRSYKRSDYSGADVPAELYISIHAPTRGATKDWWKEHVRIDISIHAPTRGATRLSLRHLFSLLFQSTLLQEERRQKCTIILILICNNYCIVSIKSHQHYNNYFM